MDARQHFATAEALIADGIASGSWQYRQAMSTEALAHATLAQLGFQAEQAGVNGFGDHQEPTEPETPPE